MSCIYVFVCLNYTTEKKFIDKNEIYAHVVLDKGMKIAEDSL